MSAAPPSSPEQPLDGRLVVVTGGGRGIGSAIAERVHDAGASVVLLGRTKETLEERCSTLERSVYEVVDVSVEEQVAEAFAALPRTPDALVANAGRATSVPFSEMTAESWRRTLAVNLDGVFHCARAVVPAMVERGSGRIVTIASTAALRGYRYVADYCAAKHGVLGLTRALAHELARSGVTVNAVCPGFTETGMLAESVERIRSATGRSEEEARRLLVRNNPQGRFIDPFEIADTVVWLLGDSARSVNGQAVAVDGGETA